MPSAIRCAAANGMTYQRYPLPRLGFRGGIPRSSTTAPPPSPTRVCASFTRPKSLSFTEAGNQGPKASTPRNPLHPRPSHPPIPPTVEPNCPPKRGSKPEYKHRQDGPVLLRPRPPDRLPLRTYPPPSRENFRETPGRRSPLTHAETARHGRPRRPVRRQLRRFQRRQQEGAADHAPHQRLELRRGELCQVRCLPRRVLTAGDANIHTGSSWRRRTRARRRSRRNSKGADGLVSIRELATDVRKLTCFSVGVIGMDSMGNCMARGAACAAD